MNLRHVFRRNNHLFTVSIRHLTTTTTTATSSPISRLTFPRTLVKPFHSTPPLYNSFSTATVSCSSSSDDAEMNEFLSRFVYSMRSKLTDAYPHCDKPTVDSMLLLVVDKLIKSMEESGGSFDGLVSESTGDGIDNDDLTTTMWEVSNVVVQEMEKEKKKEKLKMYLQSEQVKTLTRFASEVGVCGDMLREFRFKWAREEMEDAEFYSELNQLKAEAEAEAEGITEGEIDGDGGRKDGLPKRHGKIDYKLYGLDLSGEKWREVAEKVNETEQVVWPSEAKAITGKCKLVTEKIAGLGKDEDDGVVSELIREWIELLQPAKVDWLALLDNIKARDYSLYLKMAERVLEEPTFQADIRDYALLIDAHAKEDRIVDVERILKKMSEKGLPPDVLILAAMLHMYSRADNLDKAKEAYEALRRQGLKPDMQIYTSMIMAYVNANQPKLADSIMKEMEIRGIKPSEEIYIALLKAYAEQGDINGAQRIVTTMQFSGFQPTAESCTLLIQASAKSDNTSVARNNFDNMMKLGYKPDDKSTSMVILAYERKNELDKALSLLLQLEKDGFEPGVLTYSVLVDWLGKLQLIDEAEQILAKIAQLGEAPPFKLQVSLCDMYATSGVEKKALQALGHLEVKKDLLEREDFERIILSLLKGGFENDSRRMKELMEAQGFTPSDNLKLKLKATETPIRSSADQKRNR